MQNLLKIGDVSKLCNISIKTLRYYEEMGIITPVKVDIYSGYRFYDEENIETIYKIQLLKELGFSLAEIRDFDEKSLNKKTKEIKKQILELKKRIKFISSLENLKGERIMKPFINDADAVGKWGYVCSAASKEDYLKGDFYKDEDILFNNIFFLPEGKGYWVFDRWSKGEIYHFSGVVYKYHIEKDNLILEVVDEQGDFAVLLVYEKLDSKPYMLDEIRRKDDINLDFVLDENAVGFWKSLGCIRLSEKANFNSDTKVKDGIFNSFSFMPNGELLIEAKKRLIKAKWSNGVFIHEDKNTVMKYDIKRIDGKTYMFLEWKSGDYIFAGKIFDCYVFEKM